MLSQYRNEPSYTADLLSQRCNKLSHMWGHPISYKIRSPHAVESTNDESDKLSTL